MAKPRYSRKSPYSRRSEGDFRVRVGFPFAVGGADQLDRRILVSAVHPALEQNGYNSLADTPSLRLIGISSPVENNSALLAGPRFVEAPQTHLKPLTRAGTNRHSRVDGGMQEG